MKYNLKIMSSPPIGTVAMALFMLFWPFAFAYADVSVSIQSLTPGTSISAGTNVSFTVSVSGLSSPTYTVSDSFGGSSVSNSNINSSGNFSWTPNSSDVGTHVLNIQIQDSASSIATGIQEQITVNAASASLSIASLSPGSLINTGQNVTFNVIPYGFNSPSYTISDSFGNSTISNSDINSSGNFSWTPNSDDVGVHNLTIYATDSSGYNSSVSEQITVQNSALSITSISPGTTINYGTTLNMSAPSTGFINPYYTINDTFSGSSISNSNINADGDFSWTPTANDIGTHQITIYVNDSTGHSANTSTIIYVVSNSNSAVSTQTYPASGLNSSQIQTIISMLKLFGANQTALNNVSVMLNGGQTTVTSAVSTPASTAGTFTSYLSPGITSSEVTQLQTVLQKLGFFSGSITGYYGTATENAVIAFQKAHGLDQLGVVGPTTRTALNSLQNASSGSSYSFTSFLSADSTGAEVTALQQKLTSLGFYSGPVTGYYGTLTQDAVKRLQAAHGIEQAGYVGPATRAILNQ